ncbi:MAG: alpha/beta hydrolase [Ginsengibacter sp.]
MKKKNLLTTACIISVIFFAVSCRLDDNLYNATKLKSYSLDSYTGDVDFRLDASYKIPDNLISIFPLMSMAASETSPTKIYAVYIGDIMRISIDTVIMYCHGNRDNMDFYWPRAQLLANTNGKNHYGVLMIDYRGYGMSEGKPTENGLYADADAALQWLKMEGLSNTRLVMYGFSMGSAPATKLTAEPRTMTPSKLMLEAPFASAQVLVQDATGLALPAPFVTDLHINNAEEIKKVQQPFFWIQGVDDDYLNIETTGQLIYNNYKGNYKEAHRIPGASHSDVPNTFGFQNYLKAVNDFITRH